MTLTNLDTLRHNFSGEIIRPEDSAYEQARNTIAAKGAPALVVRPKTAKDVAAAIQYGRNQSLVISVRSGGHHGAGFASNTGGLVIDLGAINQIEMLDANKHIVRVGSGAVWGEVANFLKGYHLALSSGDTKSVGVGGLTLTGGIGWMVRKYGLALDSVVAVELVTADGKILRVSSADHPDLFWAIRGGGGNFGVVTYFEFEAHPVGKVYAGMIGYTHDNLPELIKKYRDVMRAAPDDLTASLTIMTEFMGNPPMVMVMLCYDGEDEATATRVIEPLKNLGKSTFQNIQVKEYADVLEEAHPPEGVIGIVNDLFAETFSDELIEAIAAAPKQAGTRVMQIRSLGGAMNRIPLESAAFPYRKSEIMMFGACFVRVGATEAEINEARKPWQGLAAFSSGAYANFLSTATAEDVAAIYPTATYERLAKVKKTYDPQNVFNQNYNIKPAS